MTHDEVRNIIEDWFSATYTRMRYTKDDAQSIDSGGDPKIIQYDDINYDTLGEYDMTNFRWICTYPGNYLIIASILFDSFAWTAGQYCNFYIYKNGNYIKVKHKEIEASQTMYFSFEMIDTLELIKNDYIDIRVLHNRGSATNLLNSAAHNIFSVHRI